MDARLEMGYVAPQAHRAMVSIDSYVRNSGLEPSLLELVKMRASQINGCAYCIDMHTKELRADGVRAVLVASALHDGRLSRADLAAL